MEIHHIVMFAGIYRQRTFITTSQTPHEDDYKVGRVLICPCFNAQKKNELFRELFALKWPSRSTAGGSTLERGSQSATSRQSRVLKMMS